MSSSRTDSESRNKYIDIAIKILCIFIAFFMWIYVMLVESPEYEQVFSHITVELLNTDSLVADKALAIYNGYGTMIDITLSGKKSVVSNIKESDIVATADVSSIANTSGRYTCKISVDVPAGCKLVDMSQDTISVYIDKADMKSVDLGEQIDNMNLPEGCFTGAIEFSLDKITVTGPAITLNNVSRAVVSLDMTGITKTTDFTKSVYLVDSRGERIESPYIDYYPKEVSVTVPVMKTVFVPLNVYFKHNFLGSGNTDVVLNPETVEVTGDAEIINAGRLIEAIEIDEKTEFKNNKCNKIVTLNAVDGVELSNSKTEVTAIINSSITTKDVVVPGENIVDTGGLPGVDYTWDKTSVTVTVMGEESVIADLDGEDITLVIDMSPYSDSNIGVVSVKANVVINSADRNKIIETGAYAINVRFLD